MKVTFHLREQENKSLERVNIVEHIYAAWESFLLLKLLGEKGILIIMARRTQWYIIQLILSLSLSISWLSYI